VTRIDESDYILLSGIQHFAFCRRQWALIEIEGVWDDNPLTMEGTLKHERAHDPMLSEKRKNIITVGEMPVHSHEMGVSGQCDIVEFIADENGVALYGRSGKWLPRPVEYKRGKPKTGDEDRLQLCAQAICLEEMLQCPQISTAYMFYWETRRREEVPLTGALRAKVKEYYAEMHGYFARKYTPRVKPSKACASCSLKNICLPKLPQPESVAAYIEKALREGGGT